MNYARKSPNKNVAIAYLRVSTEDQHLGPEAQREAIERWAKEKDMTILSWHIDKGISGSIPPEERPAFLTALEDLVAQRAGVLVAAKRDRLARDIVIAAMIERLVERKGAKVMTADGSGNGEGPEAMLMRGITDLFAQYERLIIKARTKAALAAKRAKGERTGTIPFGYKLSCDNRLEQNPHEQAILSRIYELRSSGTSIRGMVSVLSKEGVISRKGRPLTKGTIENILKRAACS